MAKEYRLTQDALKKLEEELEYLKNTREQEVADQLKEARSFGDLSENSEYDAAKDEQGKVHSRIMELQYMLSNYVLVDETQTDGVTVHIGSKVTVYDVDMEEEDVYEIVVSQDADPLNNRISEESPFGMALLGAKVGDEVEVDAPSGAIAFRIVSVE